MQAAACQSGSLLSSEGYADRAVRCSNTYGRASLPIAPTCPFPLSWATELIQVTDVILLARVELVDLQVRLGPVDPIGILGTAEVEGAARFVDLDSGAVGNPVRLPILHDGCHQRVAFLPGQVEVHCFAHINGSVKLETHPLHPLNESPVHEQLQPRADLQGAGVFGSRAHQQLRAHDKARHSQSKACNRPGDVGHALPPSILPGHRPRPERAGFPIADQQRHSWTFLACQRQTGGWPGRPEETCWKPWR